jgi:rSAM/selenodomain-associated transferase 2
MRTRQEQSCVSAVIPTLNAAGTLPATLAALAPAAAVGEVIVADGGSGDETVAVARKSGATVILGPRGRGPQLAAGAEAATGAWLLFVHADSRPGPGWEAAVSAFIAQPKAACRAGYFGFALDDRRAAARRVERAVAWRCRAMALPYGDQGLLISRTLYDEVGGYRPLPLMEDVDLVRRLGRRRLQPIPARMVTSARRYRTDGYLRRPLWNLVCLSLYFAGVPPAMIARLYR